MAFSENRQYLTYIYIYMDTTTDHFTPLALRVRGKYVRLCNNLIPCSLDFSSEII